VLEESPHIRKTFPRIPNFSQKSLRITSHPQTRKYYPKDSEVLAKIPTIPTIPTIPK